MRESTVIMVVDDHEEYARIFKEVLEIVFGCAILIAFSGKEALSKARQCPPDLVFLDIGMPGMDGYEVAAEFREDPTLSKAQLVALTGHGFPEEIDRCRRCGFRQHLLKPVQVQDLVQVVQSLELP